jgi:hypothetical protein
MADSIIPSVPPTIDDRNQQYLIIGHITKDIAPEGERMGGTAAYAGLTALAYGASPSLITSCSPDSDLSGLDGIRIHKVLSCRVTTFENRYRGKNREQWVQSVAEPLGADHIPPGWLEPSIVHFAPVAGEVQADLFHRFTKSLCCATLQGWMREWDSEGRVRHALRPEAEAAARNMQATVFSLDDVGGDEAQAVRLAMLSPVCAVTDGENGCRVYWDGRIHAFPAPKVEAADPTGAGDIFAAVFFLRLKECGDAWEAGRMATALASRSVTRPGLAGVPTRGEILEAKRIGETV